MTVYGAAGGASISGSFDRSKASDNTKTHTNSTLNANNIDLMTSGDTLIRGGNVHADNHLHTDIAGNLTVESVQDRSRSRNTSMGISGGISFGSTAEGQQTQDNGKPIAQRQGASTVGGVSGANAGMNSANGMSMTRQTVLSSLTSGGTADVNVDGHTQLVGALLATVDDEGNDLNQLTLNTGSFGSTDLRNTSLSSQRSMGLSSSVSVNSSTNQDNATNTGRDNDGDLLRANTTNLSASNQQSSRGSRTLATLGHGNITVGGTVLEQDGELTDAGRQSDSPLIAPNRDTNNTEKELWDSEHGTEIDATLDHRLTTKDGRQDIKDDFQNFGNNVQTIVEETGQAVQRAQYAVQSLGTNLDQDLRETLGQSGEQAANALMRAAGRSESEANQFLRDNPEVTETIAGLQQVREGLENPQAHAEQQQAAQIEATTQAQTQQALANGSPIAMNGETTVVGVEPEDTLPEQAMMTLGDAQRYMDDLQDKNPTAFRLAEIAIVGATGGPVKAVTTTIVDEAMNAVAGEQIAQGLETVTAHAGALVTSYDDSVDEFRQDVRSNEDGDQARIQDGGVFVASTLLGLDLPGRRRGGDVGGQQNVVDGNNPRDELTGPYNPNDTRADLEATHGADNVTSTTNPNNPVQTANSNPDKGVEVIHGSDGGKAVRVQYNDPVTGRASTANIPYNDRGLPIFDDHAKYTTNIDHSVSYQGQMRQATRDLRNAIDSGKVDSSQFTPQQLQQIQSGSSRIKNFTWHHNADTGNMQLVPKDVHSAVRHTGQGSLNQGK